MNYSRPVGRCDAHATSTIAYTRGLLARDSV